MEFNIRDALQQEMALSTGCTEVGCIALLTAVAAKELGAIPDRIDLAVSPNIMKNGINVCVPGTGGRGIPIAAAMGSVMQTPQAGLSILENANEDDLSQAEKLVAEKKIHVDLQDTDELIYAQARLEKDGHTVTATLSGGHQRISEIRKDDSVCFFAEETVTTDGPEKFHFRGIAGSALIEAALNEDPAQYEFLWDAAQTNLQAAQAGLEKNKDGIGQAMQNMEEELPLPFAAVHQAQLWTSAASEARMGGLPVPIMSIAGSGNHGIANFLGMLAVGKALGAPREEIIRAITLSSVLTSLHQGIHRTGNRVLWIGPRPHRRRGRRNGLPAGRGYRNHGSGHPDPAGHLHWHPVRWRQRILRLQGQPGRFRRGRGRLPGDGSRQYPVHERHCGRQSGRNPGKPGKDQ